MKRSFRRPRPKSNRKHRKQRGKACTVIPKKELLEGLDDIKKVYGETIKPCKRP